MSGAPNQQFGDVDGDVGNSHISDDEFGKIENYANEQSRYDREFDDIAAQENTAAEDTAAEEPDSSADTKEELGDKEKKGADGEAGGKDDKGRAFIDRLKGKSKLGQRIGIAAALGGGGLFAGAGIFLLMLPLKIEHIVDNIDQYYGAASESAISDATDHIFNDWLSQEVLPSLGSQGRCKTTATPGCVGGLSKTTGPVGQVYAAWRKNGLENKLASRHGLIFSRSGNQWFMTVHGHNVDLGDVRSGNLDVFNLPGTHEVSEGEIRSALHDALKSESFWPRQFHRFVYGRYLERQVGIKRCILICKLKPVQKLKASLADRKMAAKSYLIQRLVPEKYGVIMQCVLLGGCDDKLSPAHPGDETRMTDGQRKIQTILQDAARHFLDKDLEELAKLSRDIADKGLTTVVGREIAKTIATKLFDEAAGQAAGQAAEKAIPIIGWAILIAQIIDLAAKAGPMVRHLAFAANVATAIEYANSYVTVRDELRTGNPDPIEVASFTEALSSNLTGSSDDRVDATMSRNYGKIVEGTPASGAQSASISNLFFGKAEAAAAQPKLKCPDGSYMPDNADVCPQLIFDSGNKTLSAISDWINSIPVLPQVAHIIATLGNIVGEATGWVFQKLCDAQPFDACNKGMQQIGQWISPLFEKIGKWLIVSVLGGSMDGAYGVDLLAGGSKASYMKVNRDQLGAPAAGRATVSALQNEMKQRRIDEFHHMNMFARMFDTNNSYSLISQLAVQMPGNLQMVGTDQIASFLTNPFGRFISLMGNAFHPASAMALQRDPNAPDPFHLPDFAWTHGAVPPHPGQAWQDNHCDDPNQVADWMNRGTQNPNTGEMTTTEGNPCMLIKATAISLAGKDDPSLLPPGGPGDSADIATQSPAGDTSIPTGDAVALAQQIKNSTNISFQTPAEASAFDHIVATGHGIDCGAPAISPTMLGVILKLSQSYKLVIGVIDDGHGCDGGFHPKGSAVDLNGINPLNGSGGTGTHITFAANEVPIIQQFYRSAGQILAANGGGGLGQQQCFDSATFKVPGVTYFDDTCNHIHMDTRGH